MNARHYLTLISLTLSLVLLAACAPAMSTGEPVEVVAEATEEPQNVVAATPEAAPGEA